MDNVEIIREGKEAEDILNSDVFKKAIANLKAELLDAWEISPAKDHETREALYTAVKLLPEIEKHLRIMIEKGKINPSMINSMKGVLKK